MYKRPIFDHRQCTVGHAVFDCEYLSYACISSFPNINYIAVWGCPLQLLDSQFCLTWLECSD